MAITPSSRPSSTPGGGSYGGSSSSSSGSSSRGSSSSSGSSGSSGTTTSSTGQTFVNTTGPYSLEAARATGYTGGSSSPTTPNVQTPSPTSSTKKNPYPEGSVAYYVFMGKTPFEASTLKLNYDTKMANTSERFMDSSGGTYMSSNGGGTIEPGTYRPVVTPSAVPRTTVSDYSKMFGSTAGDLTKYRTAIGYEKLTGNQKKLADKTFEAKTNAEKKRKEDEEKKRTQVGEIDTQALVETPEQEKQRLLKEAAEQAKINAENEKKAMLESERLANEAAQSEYLASIGEEQSAADQYATQETESAAKFEENRLNQVRGDIMQALASRGVDISKLAPEQITALSGEQGVKAFTDIYSVKEKAKSNIKAARDNAMAKIQTLRANKNISQAAYNKQVDSINALTNQRLLEAENNYKNGVIGLIDKKVETAGSVSTIVYNALSGMGIPASAMGSFAGILTTSKSVGEAITKMMTSTDPKVQKAYKDNEARIKAAAEAETALKMAQINAQSASAKDPVDVMIKQLQDQAAREYALGNTAGAKSAAEQANALLATKMSTPGTPSSGASSTASPSGNTTWLSGYTNFGTPIK